MAKEECRRCHVQKKLCDVETMLCIFVTFLLQSLDRRYNPWIVVTIQEF